MVSGLASAIRMHACMRVLSEGAPVYLALHGDGGGAARIPGAGVLAWMGGGVCGGGG